MNGNLTILSQKIREEQIVIRIVRLFQENLIEKNGIIGEDKKRIKFLNLQIKQAFIKNDK